MSDVLNWPMLGITLAVFAFMCAANELGYRVGMAFDSEEPEPSRTIANAIKGSIIGLVAFLLGFAFSISSGRHDLRRQVVLDEANAIGTLHLRAGLLSPPEQSRIRLALTRYVAARLEYFDRGPSEASAPALRKDMESQLVEVWAAVEAAKARDPTVVLVSQVVPAANAVIDLNTTRGWAFRSHTPVVVLGVLLVCVFVSAGLIGHSFGQYRRRHVLLCLAFNLLFSLTLYTILDFDGPRYGLIQVDHAPLVELRSGLGATPD